MYLSLPSILKVFNSLIPKHLIYLVAVHIFCSTHAIFNIILANLFIYWLKHEFLGLAFGNVINTLTANCPKKKQHTVVLPKFTQGSHNLASHNI